MNKAATIVMCAMLVILPNTASFSWEPYDRIIAIVNDRPIVQSELDEKYGRLSKQKKIPRSREPYEMSRLLDKFIEEAIVTQEAEDQYIIVSDAKVDNHIQKIMERMRITSVKEFSERVEKTEHISYADYKEEIRKSLMTEQVMSLAIGVSPPTKKEGMQWYNANRDRLGFEVKLKHILIRPKGKSLAEEKRVNDEIKNLRRRIAGGESFESMAMKYSEDPGSASRGGDLGWVALGELDPYFANEVYRMNQPGQLSGVIKSSFGYHIVKYLGRRPITYDAVEDKIMNMLFQQKLAEQFVKWVAQRRKESDVRIYLEGYVNG